jgi:hypothetical protein
MQLKNQAVTISCSYFFISYTDNLHTKVVKEKDQKVVAETIPRLKFFY